MMTPTPQDRATEPDFLTADGEALQRWYMARAEKCGPSLVALRDRIVRQALATRPVSARALTDAEVRDLFSQLWTSLGEWTGRIARPDADMAPTTAFVDLVKRIERLALGASSSPDADALTAAKREAASKAWERAIATEWPKDTYPEEHADSLRERDKWLAREYPLAPPSVVLSDGSVVTYERYDGSPRHNEMMFVRRGGTTPCPSWWSDWRQHAITGADFDALKAFAATLSPTGAER